MYSFRIEACWTDNNPLQGRKEKYNKWTINCSLRKRNNEWNRFFKATDISGTFQL